MSLLIVSDLHIFGPEDRLYKSVIALLQLRAVKGDTVVLAGDLFDLFVGDKEIFKKRYSDFIEAVSSSASRGVRVHYIEGNHDFCLKGIFEENPKISIHSEDVSFEIEGKKFYCAHGDKADSSDYGYRLLRVFLRSLFMKWVIAALPGEWIDRIGKKSSSLSKNKKPLTLTELPVERMERLRKVYRSFAAERLALGFDFVVMGHCHDLDEMFFNIGGRQGQYINVGFPRIHGSFLSWSLGEEKIHREKLPEG